MQNQRIVVTGGAGFLGSHVVRLLLERNNMVTVFDNFYSGKINHLDPVKTSPNLRIIQGDMRNPEDVNRAFRGNNIVIHLAVLDLRQSIKEPELVNHTITYSGCSG